MMRLPSRRSVEQPDLDLRDREWVARVRAGDEAAFEQVFTTYFTALCSFVRSYVHIPDTAEEIVQSVFLRIWEQRDTWNPGEIGAYLFGACRNRALSHQRHQRIVARFEQRATRESAGSLGYHGPPLPDEQLQANELAEALRHAVHQLPERRRMALILRWEHHMSHAEIARVLGVTVKTVETHLGRAMATLRERLDVFRR